MNSQSTGRTERFEHGEYVINDAVDHLGAVRDEAALCVFDDAWARPKRGNAFGVKYPTHSFHQTGIILHEIEQVLTDGGWLIADADDWVLPRLIDHLSKQWGNVAETYEGGGYRKTGRVTLVSSDGTPDRSTPGEYLSTGGYPVVFAHKGETDRRTSESASQIARRPTERYGWGSVKPVAPYERWIEALTEPDELVLVPCAGTAPAAIAAERLDRRWLAIDTEEEARDAFLRRADAELAESGQRTLLTATDGGNGRGVTSGADREGST